MAEKQVMAGMKPLQPLTIIKDTVVYITDPSYNSSSFDSGTLGHPEGGYDVGQKIDDSEIEVYNRDKNISQPVAKEFTFEPYVVPSNNPFKVPFNQQIGFGPIIWSGGNGKVGFPRANGNHIYKATAYAKSDPDRKFMTGQLPTLYPRCDTMFGSFSCNKGMCTFYPYLESDCVLIWIGAAKGTFRLWHGTYKSKPIPYNCTESFLAFLGSDQVQVTPALLNGQQRINQSIFVLRKKLLTTDLNYTRGWIKDIKIDPSELITSDNTYISSFERNRYGILPIYSPWETTSGSPYYAYFPYTDKSLDGKYGAGIVENVMNRWALIRTYTYCDESETY